MQPGTHETRFWRFDALAGIEIAHGRYRRHAFPRHAHDGYVVSVMEEGAEQLICRGRRHTAGVGALVLLPPGTWHENRGDGSYAYRTFYLPAPWLEALDADRRPNPVTFVSPVVEGDRGLTSELLELHAALGAAGPTLEIEERLVSAFDALRERHARPRLPADLVADPEPVAVVRDYLGAHLAARVGLAALGRLVDRSPRHLLRLFRRTMGLTPHQFQMQVRLRRAADLLRRGRAPADVALALGFADQSHFTRHFTRSVGVSPGRFASASGSFKTAPRATRVS